MTHRRSLGLVRSIVVALACVSLAIVVAPVAAQDKIDVTGKWTFDVTTSGGSGTPTLTFKQAGEALTGTYDGQLGHADVKGTVKGSAINFTFTVDVQGQTAQVVYAGTATTDTMKGTVDIGPGAASGTFTAKRQ